jgi:hypothetical protein
VEERVGLVDPRLRRVVVRAVRNSYPAGRVLERFEGFLVRVFSAGDRAPAPDGPPPERPASDESWSDLLLEAPTVEAEENRDGSSPDAGTAGAAAVVVVRFYFDPDSSTGGFHRLLLHACAQFHGLDATSRASRAPIQGKPGAKALAARGAAGSLGSHRLLAACEQLSAPHERCSC